MKMFMVNYISPGLTLAHIPLRQLSLSLSSFIGCFHVNKCKFLRKDHGGNNYIITMSSDRDYFINYHSKISFLKKFKNSKKKGQLHGSKFGVRVTINSKCKEYCKSYINKTFSINTSVKASF